MWILDLLFCWIALNLMWVPTEHELSVYQLAPLQFSRPQSGSDG